MLFFVFFFCFFFFFCNDTATTEIYTLSLHDALPIYAGTFLIALALDVEFDAGAEQDPAEREHQDDDQDGDRPENQRLAGAGMIELAQSELAQPERALPHYEHHGDDQQDRREPVQQALSHKGWALPSIIRACGPPLCGQSCITQHEPGDGVCF